MSEETELDKEVAAWGLRGMTSTTVPWTTRKPSAVCKRKPTAPHAPPEWVLQAAAIAEWHKLEQEGWPFTCAGDMNAGKRSRWAAAQAKAMGLTPGESDTRLYAAPGRVLFVEFKTENGRKSLVQDARFVRLAQLGHTVLVVSPKDEEHARSIAREIATKFCDPGQGWGGL